MLSVSVNEPWCIIFRNVKLSRERINKVKLEYFKSNKITQRAQRGLWLEQDRRCLGHPAMDTWPLLDLGEGKADRSNADYIILCYDYRSRKSMGTSAISLM